jgi:hypothetical protein
MSHARWALYLALAALFPSAAHAQHGQLPRPGIPYPGVPDYPGAGDPYSGPGIPGAGSPYPGGLRDPYVVPNIPGISPVRPYDRGLNLSEPWRGTGRPTWGPPTADSVLDQVLGRSHPWDPTPQLPGDLSDPRWNGGGRPPWTGPAAPPPALPAADLSKAINVKDLPTYTVAVPEPPQCC